MLDDHRVAARAGERRERLFTERYEGLLAWALRLTNQERDAAEDLVQDAFVEFVLGRTRLEEIENVNGYLRRMLRYMHLSRKSRSAQQLPESALSIVEYSSCRFRWVAIELPRRIQASEALHQICTYACRRKESSRAGSVLILRFFHDYNPIEIAGILSSSRHSIDELQRFARREAKLFMNDPRRFGDATVSGRQSISYLNSDSELMLRLREIIFNSCQGECLSRQKLVEVYSRGDSGALTTANLAHIVSCPKCLDEANDLLALPRLAERFEVRICNSKGSRKDDPDGNALGVNRSNGGDLIKKFTRRLREVSEHRPYES